MRFCSKHKLFLCAWRPFCPTGALFVKWCLPTLTFIEQLFCQLIELWDLSEHDGDEVRMLRRRPGRSSSFNASSTWSLSSDVSAKLPVVKDQGVCWNDVVNDGRDGGGVVGRGSGFVRAITSYTFWHIS